MYYVDSFHWQIPYDIIFVGADCSWDWHSQLNLSFDIVFLLDMLVSFNTAFYDDMALLVKDRQAIAKNYIG